MSTKEDEFAVKEFTLKREEYYKVFFQNTSIRGSEWDSGVGKMVKSSRYPFSRPTRFPDLAMELEDKSGNILGSKLLFQENDDRLFTKVDLTPKSSLLSKLSSKEEIIEEHYPDWRGNSVSHSANLKYLSVNYHTSIRSVRGIGQRNLHSGFFNPVEVYDNGHVGVAHLTMPKFFLRFSEKGMSNSSVFRVSITLPYETTKNITSVKLHWLDDSWINSNLTLGSLKPKDITSASYDFDSLSSGRTGLGFKYVENDLIVTEVTEGSPSAKTRKIKTGDHILRFANPVGLMKQNFNSPLHWQPFGKLDKKNAMETFENDQYGRGRLFWDYKDLSDIANSIEKKTTPLEIIPELSLSGPPDTYVYLLIKPAQNPAECLIVPVKRKGL